MKLFILKPSPLPIRIPLGPNSLQDPLSLNVLDVNIVVLFVALLQHHLVQGVHCMATLHNMTLPTQAGTILRSRCTPKGTRVSTALIGRANMMTSNGVVHFIDQVLIPRKGNKSHIYL